MSMKILRIVVVGSTMLLALPGMAASFDCTKASTIIENAICDNAEINRLDGEVGRLYQKAMGAMAPGPRDRLRHEQLQWLSYRNKVCAGWSHHNSEWSVAQCMKPLYFSRIRYLKQELGEPSHHYNPPEYATCGGCQPRGPDPAMGCAGYDTRSGCVGAEQCSWVVQRCND